MDAHRSAASQPSALASVLAERIYATAFDALECGDFMAAERYFALLAALAPRDERAWVGLAMSREQSGDDAMAAARFLLGTAVLPNSTWCHFGRARTLRRLGRFAEAQAACDEAEATTDDEAFQRLIEQERTTT